MRSFFYFINAFLGKQTIKPVDHLRCSFVCVSVRVCVLYTYRDDEETFNNKHEKKEANKQQQQNFSAALHFPSSSINF